jgi:hypothetical protein
MAGRSIVKCSSCRDYLLQAKALPLLEKSTPGGLQHRDRPFPRAPAPRLPRRRLAGKGRSHGLPGEARGADRLGREGDGGDLRPGA